MSDIDPRSESMVHKALSIPVRRQLVELIARDGPVDLKPLIEATGLKEPTIRHHLLVLGNAGLVRVAEEHQGTRGRPRMLYSTTNTFWRMGFPKRQYVLLAEHLLRHIIDAEGDARAAEIMESIGVGVARELLDDLSRHKGSSEVTVDDVVERILPALDEMGSTVDVVEKDGCRLGVEMRNCIFFELSVLFDHVICAGHEALFQTIADAMGDFEASNLECLAHGDERCLTCIAKRP